MTHSDVKVEKIDITQLFRIKCRSKTYYITLPPDLIRQYDLTFGQFLKIHIKEVRKLIQEDDAEEKRE